MSSLAEKFNIPPALFETIRKMNAEETEYQAKVKALMKKKGITSLGQLSPEEKKDFFNTLDAMHKAKHEEVELDEGNAEEKKLEAIAKKQLSHIPGKLYKQPGSMVWYKIKGKHRHYSSPTVGTKEAPPRSYSSSNDDDDMVAAQKRNRAGIKLSYDDFIGSGYGGGGGALSYDRKRNRVREEVEQIDEVKVGDKVSFNHALSSASGRSVKKTGTVHQIDGDNVHVKVKDKYGAITHKKKTSELTKEEIELDEAIPKSTMHAVVHSSSKKIIAKGNKEEMSKKVKELNAKEKNSHFLGNSPSSKVGDKFGEEVEIEDEMINEDLMKLDPITNTLVGLATAAGASLLFFDYWFGKDKDMRKPIEKGMAKAKKDGNSKLYHSLAAKYYEDQVTKSTKALNKLRSDPKSFYKKDSDKTGAKTGDMKKFEKRAEEELLRVIEIAKKKQKEFEAKEKSGEAITKKYYESVQHIEENVKTEPPFTPDKPKKNPGVIPGKGGTGPSRAAHLAKMALRKQLKKEEIELDEGAKETATRAKELADKLRKKDPEKSKMYRKLAFKASQRSNNPTGVKTGQPYGMGNKSLRRQGIEPEPSSMSSSKMRGYFEEVKLDESKSSTGYELYHKDFSSAMAHAYDFAKKKYNIEIDPLEIDRNVAMGPRKPASGKANAYRLLDKTGKKAIQVQVANLDNKRYELNMYKEDVQIDEVAASKALQKAHDDERKKRGLPDPSYYLKLAAQKKKEIEDMKKETQKEEVELTESHFKVGQRVKCLKSGMSGTVTKVDPEGEGKYYTVKQDSGKVIKYAPDELKALKENVEEAKNPQTSMKRAALSMDRAKEVVRHQKEIGTIRRKREALRNSFEPEESIEEKALWPGTPEYQKKFPKESKPGQRYKKQDYGYRGKSGAEDDGEQEAPAKVKPKKRNVVREALDRLKKKKNEATAKESKKDFKSGDKLSGKTEPIEINPELKEQKT